MCCGTERDRKTLDAQLRAVVERGYEESDHPSPDEERRDEDPVGVCREQKNGQRTHAPGQEKRSRGQGGAVFVATQTPLDAEDDKYSRASGVDHQKPADLGGAVTPSVTKEGR